MQKGTSAFSFKMHQFVCCCGVSMFISKTLGVSSNSTETREHSKNGTAPWLAINAE